VIIDVHCHLGYSDLPRQSDGERFAFEDDYRGADGRESYFSTRMLRRPGWFFIKRQLGVDPRLPPGPALDRQIRAINEQHFAAAISVDRLCLLAFDAYHDDNGNAIGPVARKSERGSDLYTSNSLVRSVCLSNPEKLLFGASIHPYRAGAVDALRSVADAGAALIKWLPVHQNIDARDRRTIAFLEAAAELELPILVHYGGEMSLTTQHSDQEHPGAMLETLRELKARRRMPKMIVAHAATPSMPWQNADGHRLLVEALMSEFAEAPLYADISALAAFGRTTWLKRLRKSPSLHRKLVFGTDFPIPVMLPAFARLIGLRRCREIARLPSWIERAYQLKRALGYRDEVFINGARILRIR